MATMTKKPARTARAKGPDNGPPVLLKTPAEVREYLAKHLKPVRYGPKGQPIYSHEERMKLNAIFYPDA